MSPFSTVDPDSQPPPASVLVTGAGDSDPFAKGLVSGEEHPGPALTLLSRGQFERLLILDDGRHPENARALAEEAARRQPALRIFVESIGETEGLPYNAITARLQLVVDALRAESPSCLVNVCLNAWKSSAHFAWMRITYRNPGIRLLQVTINLNASSEPARIDTVEESHSRETVPMLREQDAPLQDELAQDLDIVGTHPTFRHLLDTAAALARFDSPVLITGEPGSGKTSLAGFIWRCSPRALFHMRVADPSSLPDSLAAMLLFGAQDSGAASGVNVGLLSACSGGTLLVKNVDKLSLSLQEALAEYLRTGCFRPARAPSPVHVNARILFTSLDDSINGPSALAPALREILLPTLLRVPPLRERREDIALIALHYLRRINMSLRTPRSLPRHVLHALEAGGWHGNIRELRQAIERAALLSPDGPLKVEGVAAESGKNQQLLSQTPIQPPEIGENFSLEGYLSDVRRKLILRALELSGGNQSEAARMLRITPQAVHQFLKFQRKPHEGKPGEGH
jgi:two-component system NtrC family response regulator